MHPPDSTFRASPIFPLFRRLLPRGSSLLRGLLCIAQAVASDFSFWAEVEGLALGRRRRNRPTGIQPGGSGQVRGAERRMGTRRAGLGVGQKEPRGLGWKARCQVGAAGRGKAPFSWP